MSKISPQIKEIIFDALPEAYALLQPVDDKAVIVDCNLAYARMLGVEKDLLVGQNLLETLPHHLQNLSEEDLGYLQDIVFETKTDQQVRSTNIMKHDTGEEDNTGLRFLCFRHTPLPDSISEGNGYLIQKLEDLSDQLTTSEKTQSKTLNPTSRQELYLRNEDLIEQINYKITQYEAASKELNDFIYSVSHDLRAPLRRIDGFSQELINEYMDQLDETGAHYLKRVRQGTQDMGNLIDDLLKLSRISRRKVELKTVDVSKVAKSACDELLEMENNREIEIQIEDGLQTEVDEGLLKVIMMNLISNAVKFTAKEKKAVIEVGSTYKDDEIYFYIKDNGVGFDPAYSDKLFKAFDRLHSQKEFPGTGIGLATVKRIINLHNGDIQAESTPGKGATFFFNFKQPKNSNRS